MEQFQGAETCHLGMGLPCLQNQVICYGYATKWLWVVGNERKLYQSIDIEGKNPEKPMLMLHRETSMHCCYPAIYGKSGQSWAPFPLSTLRTWAFLSVGEVEEVALRLSEFAVGKSRIFSHFEPTPLWSTAKRYLSPSGGVKRALNLR